MNKFYPSWSLGDLKKIPHRMRNWWIQVGVWQLTKGE